MKTTIGQYEVVEKIGSGGMATVFKAYQPKLDRHVAIKVMHQNIAQDTNFLARFEREARIVARLDHPHIVPIYDFDEVEGQPFLVMKYVEGRTLKNILRDGPMQSDQTLKIVEEIGDALQYAHERGILHRDIKPSNILIDERGHAYLTDFGLARIAQQGESTMSVDVMLGTPHYISPEQAQGQNDVDSRTDVYSLGIVMYELVTGRVPFFGDTSYAIIHSQINTPPQPPHEINPDIPLEVEAVLLKALEKDREKRYSSPADLVRAYQQAIHGQSIAAPTSQVAPRGQTPTPVLPNGTFWDGLRQRFENFGQGMEAFGEAMEREFADFDKVTANMTDGEKWEESKRRFGSAFREARGSEEKPATEIIIGNSKRPFIHVNTGKSKKKKNKADSSKDKDESYLTPQERVRRRVEKRMEQQREELAGLLIHAVVFFVINSWLFGFSGWLSQLFAGENPGLPSLITMFWGIGLFAQTVNYLTNYGPGYHRRSERVDREVEREFQRMGLAPKLKNEDLVDMRLTDDGELTESFMEELQDNSKRNWQ